MSKNAKQPNKSLRNQILTHEHHRVTQQETFFGLVSKFEWKKGIINIQIMKGGQSDGSTDGKGPSTSQYIRSKNAQLIAEHLHINTYLYWRSRLDLVAFWRIHLPHMREAMATATVAQVRREVAKMSVVYKNNKRFEFSGIIA